MDRLQQLNRSSRDLNYRTLPPSALAPLHPPPALAPLPVLGRRTFDQFSASQHHDIERPAAPPPPQQQHQQQPSRLTRTWHVLLEPFRKLRSLLSFGRRAVNSIHSEPVAYVASESHDKRQRCEVPGAFPHTPASSSPPRRNFRPVPPSRRPLPPSSFGGVPFYIEPDEPAYHDSDIVMADASDIYSPIQDRNTRRSSATLPSTVRNQHQPPPQQSVPAVSSGTSTVPFLGVTPPQPPPQQHGQAQQSQAPPPVPAASSGRFAVPDSSSTPALPPPRPRAQRIPKPAAPSGTFAVPDMSSTPMPSSPPVQQAPPHHVSSGTFAVPCLDSTPPGPPPPPPQKRAVAKTFALPGLDSTPAAPSSPQRPEPATSSGTFRVPDMDSSDDEDEDGSPLHLTSPGVDWLHPEYQLARQNQQVQPPAKVLYPLPAAARMPSVQTLGARYTPAPRTALLAPPQTPHTAAAPKKAPAPARPQAPAPAAVPTDSPPSDGFGARTLRADSDAAQPEVPAPAAPEPERRVTRARLRARALAAEKSEAAAQASRLAAMAAIERLAAAPDLDDLDDYVAETQAVAMPPAAECEELSFLDDAPTPTAKKNVRFDGEATLPYQSESVLVPFPSKLHEGGIYPTRVKEFFHDDAIDEVRPEWHAWRAAESPATPDNSLLSPDGPGLPLPPHGDDVLSPRPQAEEDTPLRDLSDRLSKAFLLSDMRDGRRVAALAVTKRREEEGRLRRQAAANAARRQAEAAEAAAAAAAAAAAEKAAAEAEEKRRQREVASIIKPLDGFWRLKVQGALATDDQAAELTPTGLTRKDLGTVLPSTCTDGIGWLDDEIVNNYLAAMTGSKLKAAGYVKGDAASAAGPPYHAFSTHLYTTFRQKGWNGVARWFTRARLAGTRLLACRRVLIPVNDKSHWTLVAVNGVERTIEYFDSMGGAGGQYTSFALALVRSNLGQDFVESEWQVRAQTSQQQENALDCGVFVCMNALALVTDREPATAFRAAEMPDARRQVAATLLNGGFSGAFSLE